MKLLAIDLDGTLVDSAPDLAVAVNAALGSLSLPSPDDASIRGWIGDGVEALVERALAAMGGDPARQLKPALAVFGAVYAEHLFDRSRLYDGVEQTLTRLRASGLGLACVTNKKEAFARAVLARAGILEPFELVVGGDTLDTRKPDPGPLRAAAERFGATPEQSAMVGDSHHDLSAADAAGFSFIWASYGYCSDPGHMASGRFQRIDRFADLMDLL